VHCVYEFVYFVFYSLILLQIFLPKQYLSFVLSLYNDSMWYTEISMFDNCFTIWKRIVSVGLSNSIFDAIIEFCKRVLMREFFICSL
jgi:hypothetical protein